MTGRFITLEGIEGAGKSTTIPFLEALIKSRGHDVVVTREPGGTPIGEKIRDILLADHSITSMAELLLVFAARAQHLDEIIKPALERGQWVVCDRFTDASYAYQGGGRGMAMEWIGQLENMVQQSLRPDLCLLFDLPVEVGLTRARNRSEADRFERERGEFFLRARQVYLERAHAQAYPYAVIDAARSPKSVTEQVASALNFS